VASTAVSTTTAVAAMELVRVLRMSVLSSRRLEDVLSTTRPTARVDTKTAVISAAGHAPLLSGTTGVPSAPFGAPVVSPLYIILQDLC
jgi:hypothetical protein